MAKHHPEGGGGAVARGRNTSGMGATTALGGEPGVGHTGAGGTAQLNQGMAGANG